VTCKGVVAFVSLAACSTIEAPLDTVSGNATAPLKLSSPVAPPADASLRWRIGERPADSVAVDPPDGTPTTFVPDVRGTYLVELWISEGVSDDLSHRFEIDVAGAPPVAIIGLGPPGTAGSTITADANQSYSPESLPITFTWRLAMRPSGSVAVLTSTNETTTSFVGDVAGAYALELTAFDGELASDPPTTAMIHVDP
jgi:hypothetical protein